MGAGKRGAILKMESMDFEKTYFSFYSMSAYLSFSACFSSYDTRQKSLRQHGAAQLLIALLPKRTPVVHKVKKGI